jgi:hypothetical protein
MNNMGMLPPLETIAGLGVRRSIRSVRAQLSSLMPTPCCGPHPSRMGPSNSQKCPITRIVNRDMFGPPRNVLLPPFG